MPPPPKHPSQRRRRNVEQLTQLPAEGRQGPTPPWPYEGISRTEQIVWRDLWTLPQAVMWERLRWTRAVARYVRLLVATEDPDTPINAAAMTEVRHAEDRLGLSPLALLRLKWEVVADEVGEARAARAVRTASAGDVPLLSVKAVDPGAVAGA